MKRIWPHRFFFEQLIMARKRDTVLSVSKGIAIILMVAGHAEAPELVTNFIYTFHMPLFFMAAGYFSAAGISTTRGVSSVKG